MSLPVERSQPVKWYHQLQNVSPKENVISHRLFTLCNQVAAVDGPDQEATVNDDGLAQV